MKRPLKLRPLSLTVAVLSLLGSSTLLAAPPFRDGKILVKPRAGMSEEQLAKLVEKDNGKVHRKLRGIGVHVVEVPAGKELQVVNRLNKERKVAFAEPDMLVSPEAIPNDPNYASEWHLPVMRAPDAWQYGSGQGVTVAVCDTGIDAAHPDLSGQLVSGWNTAGNNADTSDIYGHGTKVAGVVAAKTNNLLGVAAVAPSAKILAMRITDRTDGYAYYSDMAECVTWAADHGARVANISFSGAPGSSTIASAASYMMSKTQGVVVVSAGNDGADKGYTNSPYLFTAAATESGDTRAGYSNFGTYVDIAAPGSGIYTTVRGGTYGAVSGTSFSAPNTAAVAALVMAANPNLTSTDVTSVITGTAKDLGDAGWDAYFGHGRVDALAAVQLAANANTSDTTPPAVAVVTPGAGATVKELVPIDVQATDAFGVASVDLLVDGVVVATDTDYDPVKPNVFTFGWDSTKVSDGSHRVKARAKDAAGNVGNATEITVNVVNQADTVKPTVSLSSPKSGDSFTVGSSVSLNATGSDNVGVTNLSIYAGGALKCTGTSSASCSWSTSGLAAGTYQVSATAKDAAGNQETVSASITLTAPTTTTDPVVTKKTPPGLKKK
jgi:subtilisin family serine protease